MPLAEHLRELNPSVLQPWYANDFAMEGPVSRVTTLFKVLCQKGPGIGYFPSPPKSWAICPCVSEPSSHQIFKAASLQVNLSSGQQYVGGFIGSKASGICKLVSCLMAEWQFVCRIVPDIGPPPGAN